MGRAFEKEIKFKNINTLYIIMISPYYLKCKGNRQLEQYYNLKLLKEFILYVIEFLHPKNKFV